jgi:hypothetical protein
MSASTVRHSAKNRENAHLTRHWLRQKPQPVEFVWPKSIDPIDAGVAGLAAGMHLIA